MNSKHAQLKSSFAKSKTNENEIKDFLESKWFQLSSDILGIYVLAKI